MTGGVEPQPNPMPPGQDLVGMEAFLEQVAEGLGEDFLEGLAGGTLGSKRRKLVQDQIVQEAKYGTIQYFQELAAAGKLDFPPSTIILPPPEGDGNPPTGGKGNTWLDNPNMGAAVTYYFMAVMKMLQYSRVVELSFKLEAMEWIGLLAKESAELTLRSAELEADRLELQAMSAMIQGAVNLGMAVGTAGVIGFTSSTGGWALGIQAGTPNMIATGLSHFVDGATKFMEAGIVVEKGKVDAWKEEINGIQRIAEQMMQSSFQSDQELEELLKKVLDLLKSIWEQLFQTMGRIFSS